MPDNIAVCGLPSSVRGTSSSRVLEPTPLFEAWHCHEDPQS
jgi:hypothetical protein